MGPIQAIHISSSALLHNLNFFRRLAPHSLFLAVVKSNAYGHGLKEVLTILNGKVDYLGLNSLGEALSILSLDFFDPKTPLLIMGLNALELRDLEKMPSPLPFSGELHFVISSEESLQLFYEYKGSHPKEKVFFHLKVDTGLSRLGFEVEELRGVLEKIQKSPILLESWKGLMTHFANVEDVTKQEYARKQIHLFEKVMAEAKARHGGPLLCHAAASAAAMLLPGSHLDMIRIGISLYGLWASPKTRLSFLSQDRGKEHSLLQPVLSWSSRIVHIHRVKSGSYIGYGCTYRAEQDMRLGVAPVGYYEGYERALSGRAYVLLRGQRSRLLGRVSMNMICLDLSPIKEARLGDEVTLIGKNGEEYIGADDLSEMTGTINYEVLTRINAKLPRKIID